MLKRLQNDAHAVSLCTGANDEAVTLRCRVKSLRQIPVFPLCLYVSPATLHFTKKTIFVPTVKSLLGEVQELQSDPFFHCRINAEYFI